MKRAVALGLVALAVALAAVATRLIGPPTAGRAVPRSAAAVGGLAAATSSVWSCAGPLPLGKTVKSSIELANSGAHTVRAAVRFSSTSGPPGQSEVSVPPGGLAVVRPNPAAGGMAAASVVAEGGGLSAVEVIHGSSGPIAAPCAASTAHTEYLLAGDTRRNDTVQIALFDPTATPAVASVSFATQTGRVAPPTFQGVPVGAGQLVVLPVAERVPFQAELAATVTSVGSGLAVGAYDTTFSSGTPLATLERAACQTSPHWFFPTAPAGSTSSQTIDLFDPQAKPARVTLGYLPEQGGGRFDLVVPPGGVARVALPSGTSPRTLGAPEIESTNGVAIVAARELRVSAAISPARVPGASQLARERRAYTLVGHVPMTYTVTEGVARPQRHWVIGGGESDLATAMLVELTNPAATPATVEVAPIGAANWRTTVALVPYGSAVLDLADQPQITGRFALRVAASRPVVVDGALYAKGAFGFTSPSAIPD